MRNKLNDVDYVNFQSYIFETLNPDKIIEELSDSEFNFLYKKYLDFNKNDDVVVSLSKNSPLNKSESESEIEVEKTLDDYLMEMDIYVDLNNLSPEAVKKILIASEKKFKEAEDTYEESNEMLDESIKYLKNSEKHLEEAHNLLTDSKGKPKNSKYSFGKLVHTMYDDGKSLFGYAAIVFVAIAVFGGPYDEYEDKDKVLTHAIQEESFFDKSVQSDYLENDVEINLKKLESFYDDTSIILEKGYDSKADKDYLKSIYIKSIILNESLDSLKVSDTDFQADLNKLINELEVDLDIETNK